MGILDLKSALANDLDNPCGPFLSPVRNKSQKPSLFWEVIGINQIFTIDIRVLILIYMIITGKKSNKTNVINNLLCSC
jgi:hypothetical protein